MTVILCTKCGTRNEETASFCGGCGAFLEFYGQKVAADGAASEAASSEGVAAITPAAPAATAAESAAPTAVEIPPTPAVTTPGPTPSSPSVETESSPPSAGAETAPEPAPSMTPVVEAPVRIRPASLDALADEPKADGHSAEVTAPDTAASATPVVETPPVEPMSAGMPAPDLRAQAAPAPVPQGPEVPIAEAPIAAFLAADAPVADAPVADVLVTSDALPAAAGSDTIDVADAPEAPPPVPPAPRPRRGGPSRRFAVTTGPAETPTSTSGDVPPDTSAFPSVAPSTPAPISPTPIAAGPIMPAAIMPASIVPPPPPPAQPVARHPTLLDSRSDAPTTPLEGPPARLPVAAPEKPVGPPDQPAARLPTEELRRTPPRPTTPQPEARVARPGDLVCANCGVPNEPSRHFCASCGRSLATSSPLPATADPWWRRLLRRLFGRRRAAAPVPAGERTAQLQSGTRGGGRVLAGIRTMVLTIVAILIGFAIVGYLAVPSIHTAADDLVHQVTSAFVTPVHVYPDTVTGKALPGHGPQFAVDKTHNLFWAAPLGAQPPSLDFRFNAAIDLTAIIVTPGAETDINGYARPRLIRLTIGDAAPIERTLDDAQLVDASGGGGGKVLAFQVLDLPASTVNEVKLDVLSVYPGKRNAVAIGEVEFVARP